MIVTNPMAAAASAEAKARSQLASAGGEAFSKALQAAQPPPSAVPSPALACVNPMLLHEIALSEKRRRDGEARRRGQALLDGLAELQVLLLGPGGEGQAIDRIADLLSSIPQADDPELASIVRGIAVRAAVEVARRSPR